MTPFISARRPSYGATGLPSQQRERRIKKRNEEALEIRKKFETRIPNSFFVSNASAFGIPVPEPSHLVCELTGRSCRRSLVRHDRLGRRSSARRDQTRF